MCMLGTAENPKMFFFLKFRCPNGYDPQITIHLSDVNDEKPMFVRQPSGECASVSEFLNPGETVLSISALDKDEPGSLNSRLVFSMDIDQPENGAFRTVNCEGHLGSGYKATVSL